MYKLKTFCHPIHLRIKLPLLVSCLLSLVSAVSLAYNADHGPWEKGQVPKAFPLQECSMITEKDKHDLPITVVTFTPTNGVKDRIIIKHAASDSGSLEIWDSVGRLAAEVDLESACYAPMQAYFGDLNADSKTDYVIYTWWGGNGLACGYSDVIFILSNKDGFKIQVVTTLFPEHFSFYDVNEDGKAEFLHTTFIYGEEKSPDKKLHNYWVYNLLTVEGDRLKLANNLDKQFPKWIWYSHAENHKETAMLTQKQKDEHWKDYASSLDRQLNAIDIFHRCRDEAKSK